MGELMARDLTELEVAALMIDGSTSPATAAWWPWRFARRHQGPGRAVAGRHREQDRRHRLLADLSTAACRRRRLLVVIDGAKASPRRCPLFGELCALVQRCALHKRRNVTDHLPLDRGWVDQRLARAFNNTDPAAGLHQARALARQLETRWPKTPPPASAKGSRRCSPFAASASATGSPAASRAPT